MPWPWPEPQVCRAHPCPRRSALHPPCGDPPPHPPHAPPNHNFGEGSKYFGSQSIPFLPGTEGKGPETIARGPATPAPLRLAVSPWSLDPQAKGLWLPLAVGWLAASRMIRSTVGPQEAKTVRRWCCTPGRDAPALGAGLGPQMGFDSNGVGGVACGLWWVHVACPTQGASLSTQGAPFTLALTPQGPARVAGGPCSCMRGTKAPLGG